MNNNILKPLSIREVICLYRDFVKSVESIFPNENIKSQIILGAGGAMVMLGLRETTNDIDLEVPEKVFDYFGKIFGVKEPEDHAGVRLVSVAPQVDIHISFNKEETYDFPVIEDNRIYYSGAESTLWLKQQLNRPKDQEDIKKLKHYLQLNS